MKMELQILGSGSAVPTLTRYPTSQVLNIQENYLLIDCGEGAQMQMRRFGVKMQRINHIFISHLHGDHYLGLSGYLQTLHLLGRDKAITIYGPPELEEIILSQFRSINAQLRYDIIFKPTQAKEKELLFENKLFEVYSFPLRHKIPTTGFYFVEKAKKRKYLPEQGEKHGVPYYWIDRIKQGANYEKEDGSIVENKILTTDADPSYSYAYCSDTAPFKELKDHLPSGIDLMYHEASFLNDKADRAKATLHSTAEGAGMQAQLCEVKKLILGHFSARYTHHQKFIQDAQIHFKGETLLAEDGMLISIY